MLYTKEYKKLKISKDVPLNSGSLKWLKWKFLEISLSYKQQLDAETA